MKLRYLGTAAAEGIPGMFCDCELCRNARKVGGREIRTRSQALLDDKILLDFPADTYMHMLNFGLELHKIHTLVVTHAHMDHLYERDFWCRNPGIGNEIEEKPLVVYATEAGYNQVAECLKSDNVPEDRVRAEKIVPFVPFEAEGYKFTALKADHDQSAGAVFYIIEHEGKTMLYAHDTGYFPEESWGYLAKSGLCFDFVSLDCTNGFLEYSGGHMGLVPCVKVYEKLTELGLCDGHTKACLNHFSHNGAGATYEKMCEAAKEHGFEVSYDGMTVEF